MARMATKTLHITEKTWNALFNKFKIKCTNDEIIATLIRFINVLDYNDKDCAGLILEYREFLIEQEKELIIAQ